jgi:DNA repair exonuclease SbcCD ATPase subunit
MGLLESIDKLITERGSAAILRERLDLLREQGQAINDKVAALEQENSRLKRELEECQRNLAAATTAKKFVEHRGALFERTPSGAYSLSVRCPTCQRPFGLIDVEVPFYCSRCQHRTQFNAGDLEKVIEELPQ